MMNTRIWPRGIYWLSAMLLIGTAGVAPVRAQATPGTPGMDPAIAAKSVLAVVDGVKITAAQVEQQLQQRLAAMAGEMGRERAARVIPQLSRQIIEEMIQRILITNEVKTKGITVDEETLTAGIKEVAQRLPEGEVLSDATEAALREQLAAELAVRKLLTQELEGDTATDDQEVEAFYRQNRTQIVQPATVHARHILVKVEAGAPRALRNARRHRAEGVRKKILDGADFAATAKAVSDCPSAAQGGDLGTFGRGRMVAAFEEAAFARKVGEVGPIVETLFGFHIIEVLEHNEERQLSLDEAKEQIRQMLSQAKWNEAYRQYLETLRKKAKVIYLDQLTVGP